MKIVIDQKPDKWKQSQKRKPIIAATFPEDLGISAVSSFMSRQRQDMEMEEVGYEDAQTEDPPPSVTTIAAQELPSNRYRLYLIRHKYATSTDLSTLQLFKVFTTAAKKTDKTMAFLPVDSKKQSLPPLMSQKQIDSLTSNHLRLYFSSFYRDQHHSISGFIHIVTSLTLEDFGTKFPLAEWFQTYQYSITLCKSQDEEMSLVGALCYGSLFLHRDGLLQGIKSHPAWLDLNKDQEKPIIIDLVVKSFKSPGKSVDMIFVRAERSKKEARSKLLSSIV
jgi:hypothetical protein